MGHSIIEAILRIFFFYSESNKILLEENLHSLAMSSCPMVGFFKRKSSLKKVSR